MSETTVLPPSPCPFCGRVHDCATDPLRQHTPAPGSYLVCISCAEVAILGEDLQQRRPTAEEMEQLQASDTWRMVRALRTAIKLQRLGVRPIRPPGPTRDN